MFGRKESKSHKNEEARQGFIDAIQEIEDYVSSAEFGSARHLAFTDTLEIKKTSLMISGVRRKKYDLRDDYESLLNQRSAISETIRIRRDTIRGYFKEKQLIDNLISKAVIFELRSTSNRNEFDGSDDSFKAEETVIDKLSVIEIDILTDKSA